MLKSHLQSKLKSQFKHLKKDKIEKMTASLFMILSSALANHQRIEIRNFGSFYIQKYSDKIGINPYTGEKIAIKGKFIPKFKASKSLLRKINDYH